MPKPKLQTTDATTGAGRTITPGSPPYTPARWVPRQPTPQPIREVLIAEGFNKISGDADVKQICEAVMALDARWLEAGQKIDRLSHDAAIADFRAKLAEAAAAADGRKLDTKADYLKSARQSRHPLKVAQVEVSMEAAEIVKPLYQKLTAAFTEMAQARAAEELTFADAADDSPSKKLKALAYAPLFFERELSKLGQPRNVRPAHFLFGAKL